MIQRAGPVLTLRRDFSPREREIAEMIGDEKSYAEIGRALDISPRTVQTYTARMARKINVAIVGVDEPRALEPRVAIYMLVQHERWERRQFIAGKV